MFLIFVTGTAGSGKSLLTSVLAEWYEAKGAHTATVNLDPGAANLSYSPDVDIRNYIEFQKIMDSYMLGPNGALILASDLIATRIHELQRELDEENPEYAIIDTPGQVELFAYRSSGPYIVENLRAEGKTVLFLFDSTLVSTPTNLVSISLLAVSLQLRLRAPQIPVLSKRDQLGAQWKKILRWASDAALLEDAIGEQVKDEAYLLTTNILRTLARAGFAHELIPVSSTTREGMVELSATITRILRGGEEVED